ncbi:MAG: PHB depolymerase family esterase [Pseudomonadota bacterium]
MQIKLGQMGGLLALLAIVHVSFNPTSAVAQDEIAGTSDVSQVPTVECGGVQLPCDSEGGTYHLAVPQTPPRQAGYPVLIHLHGWASSGSAVMKNRGLVETANRRGYVVIAPTGLKTPWGKRDWSVRDGADRPRRDEIGFLQGVLKSVAAKLPVNTNQVLLSGFSRGGSMVWDIACAAPETFAAYAPLAGGFWAPLPRRCSGPARLFHTHGWADVTVPMEGRRLGRSRMVQGDIFAGLRIWRQTNGCLRRVADERITDGERWTRNWTSCNGGKDLRLMLHPGGHGMPKGWVETALDWFEAEVPPTKKALATGSP